jgi:hypothetical protein
MSINITKEEILQIKLKLSNLFKLKCDAARANEWEAAAGYRDEEKLNMGKLVELRNEIIHHLKNFKPSSENIDDYVFLQGLLLEFHSVEFYDDCIGETEMEIIESHIKQYWNLRDQMQQDLLGFLNESYVYLREQMHQFVKEGDKEKGKMILNKLTAISDLIVKIRR